MTSRTQEPTKHQYDYDVASTMAFLHAYSLQHEFKLNVECNHATLAGHSCEHELAMASAFGVLGALDANTGDPQTGWDTDQFLTDVTEATLLMAVILKQVERFLTVSSHYTTALQGGLEPAGINFDAKLRRESIDVEDLVIAHIGAMDALARGLRNAAAMLEEGVVEERRKARYASFDTTALGMSIRSGKTSLEALEKVAIDGNDPHEDVRSGQAELHDTIVSWYVQ